MLIKTQINSRNFLAFVHDVFASALAWFIAFWLRFNLDGPQPWLDFVLQTLPWIVPVQALIFWQLGLYRGIWRYASLLDLKGILLAVGIAGLSVPLILLMGQVHNIVPRSVLVLDPILLAALMCGSRLAFRLWKEHRLYGVWRNQGEPVLVMGAGEAAATLIKELSKTREWRVVGFLDDDPVKRSRNIHGVKVLGRLDEVGALADRLGVKRVIIVMPSADSKVRRAAIDHCTKAGLSAFILPSFSDLLGSKSITKKIRKVQVEDLLGREPVILDTAGLHEFLMGQVVMVTGGGGSIGSELCRQIIGFKPNLLVLFEMNEFSAYQVEQEFSQAYPDQQIVYIIGDIKNQARVEQVLSQYRPKVIFHAAAYKHVPLMEDHNAWEAIQNNVQGTYTIATAAIKHNVEKFVLISTDKAVNPVNVMGASKRLAEMVCQGLQRDAKTRFAMVRFGNVLGSTGSVIPKFYAQIAKGGPITVTHPEVIRYFMSIPEAARLVLQAGLMELGGEIFLLDMGEPIKIADLAKDMIKLSGYTEDEIKIIYTGLRSGEKLFEELLSNNEFSLPTPHPKLRMARARQVEKHELINILEWLVKTKVLNDDQVRRDLRRLIPEYQPNAKPDLRMVAPDIYAAEG